MSRRVVRCDYFRSLALFYLPGKTFHYLGKCNVTVTTPSNLRSVTGTRFFLNPWNLYRELVSRLKRNEELAFVPILVERGKTLRKLHYFHKRSPRAHTHTHTHTHITHKENSLISSAPIALLWHWTSIKLECLLLNVLSWLLERRDDTFLPSWTNYGFGFSPELLFLMPLNRRFALGIVRCPPGKAPD